MGEESGKEKLEHWQSEAGGARGADREMDAAGSLRWGDGVMIRSDTLELSPVPPAQPQTWRRTRSSQEERVTYARKWPDCHSSSGPNRAQQWIMGECDYCYAWPDLPTDRTRAFVQHAQKLSKHITVLRLTVSSLKCINMFRSCDGEDFYFGWTYVKVNRWHVCCCIVMLLFVKPHSQ